MAVALGFHLGAAVELFMIKVYIKDTNFYEVAKKKEVQRRENPSETCTVVGVRRTTLRAARAGVFSRRRRAWCTRGLLLHLSLYFCGLHGAAASSQVQLCGTLLSQSAEPDLSQLFFSGLANRLY